MKAQPNGKPGSPYQEQSITQIVNYFHWHTIPFYCLLWKVSHVIGLAMISHSKKKSASPSGGYTTAYMALIL